MHSVVSVPVWLTIIVQVHHMWIQIRWFVQISTTIILHNVDTHHEHRCHVINLLNSRHIILYTLHKLHCIVVVHANEVVTYNPVNQQAVINPLTQHHCFTDHEPCHVHITSTVCALLMQPQHDLTNHKIIPRFSSIQMHMKSPSLKSQTLLQNTSNAQVINHCPLLGLPIYYPVVV